MGVPDFQTLMLPFLKLTDDGQEHSIASISAKLAEVFKLTEEDITEMLPSGRQSRYRNRVNWVATHYRKAGVIESTGRGRFKITERGKALLQSNPDRIDMVVLERFPEYCEFRGLSSVEPEKDIKDEDIKTKPPDELIEELALKLKKQIALDLLEQIKQSPPEKFEFIVLDVLVEMGYGGSAADAQRIGRTGDGGIDGIIKEDKLGLDFICVQAKRWQNQVGVGTVREFAGSLLDRKARKGVLITTSYFSNDALEYAERAGNIVLIDGERFAELMIENSVGVSVIDTYKLYRVDSDYFED